MMTRKQLAGKANLLLVKLIVLGLMAVWFVVLTAVLAGLWLMTR